MERVQFDMLEVLEQINYINNELSKGGSLRNISEALTMSKTTIRDRFIKIDYIYNKELKQYCKDNALKVQIHESITKTPQRSIKQVTEPIEKGNTKELQKYDSTKGLQKYNDDILELINNKTELLEMLKDYKSNTKIINMPQLNINSLPQELQTDIINKSIKIYDPVYNAFDELCKSYSSIKKQDLLSLALHEFTNKYKK